MIFEKLFKIFRKEKTEETSEEINEVSEQEPELSYTDSYNEYTNNLVFVNNRLSRRVHIKKGIISNPNTRQIIYIQGKDKKDEGINKFMEMDLEWVKLQFKQQGYIIFYLPEFLSKTEQIIQYKLPDISSNKIEDLNIELNEHDFNIFNYIDNKEDFPKGFNSAFLRYIGSEDEDTENTYAFSYFMLDPYKDTDANLYKTAVLRYLSGIYTNRIFYRLVKPTKDETADYYFRSKAKELMNEVREKIELLRNYGVSEMLLKGLLEPSTKLSSILITADFKIFLPDYNNIEIKLEPLNKAVFILFLRHEEGILFKHLIDYRSELEDIYSEIIKLRCEKKHKNSIANVCDPTKNSINEKCARIREAFISQFDESLAMNYFVTGERGETKQIILPRELVIWE